MSKLPVEIQKRSTIERVLVNKKGTAVHPERATILGVKSDIIFLCDDDFALGTPEDLRSKAYNMWNGSWKHFYDQTNETLRPISEYCDYLAEQRKTN